MAFSMIALGIIIGCSSKNGQPTEPATSDGIDKDSVVQQVDNSINDSIKAELERAGIEDLDGAIEDFFTEVFDAKYYEDSGFIEKYCTENLKKKLKEEVDVDTEGEEGYASWLFRSDAQDGPSNEYKLIKFIPEGNGWYKYDFIDMGISGSHRIKFIVHVNPRNEAEFYIDELE